MNLRRIRNAWHLLIVTVHQRWIHAALRRQGVVLDPTATIKGRCRITAGVRIGANTIIQSCELDGSCGLSVGANVILDQCVVLTAQQDLDSHAYGTTYAPVAIGDYAIIYRQSLVLPGRTIGRGAAVAAGSVVTRDVPPMTVVGGNPARPLRTRATVHDGCDLPAMGGANLGARLRRGGTS